MLGSNDPSNTQRVRLTRSKKRNSKCCVLQLLLQPRTPIFLQIPVTHFFHIENVLSYTFVPCQLKVGFLLGFSFAIRRKDPSKKPTPFLSSFPIQIGADNVYLLCYLSNFRDLILADGRVAVLVIEGRDGGGFSVN